MIQECFECGKGRRFISWPLRKRADGPECEFSEHPYPLARKSKHVRVSQDSPSDFRAHSKDPHVGLSEGAGALGNRASWVFQGLALGSSREVHISGPRPTLPTQKLCRWGGSLCFSKVCSWF